MTESAGQFTTEKYTEDFSKDQSVISKMPAQTVKFDGELSVQRSLRKNSVKNSNTSPPKSQPQKYYNGLTEKQRTEAYFDLYDQNLRLRTKQNEMEAQIKKLTTQLMRLTKDIKPGNSMELEEKNEELQQEIKNLKAKIAGFARPKTSRPMSSALKKKPQVRGVEKVPANYDIELKEREEIITLLRDQLEATETELLRSKAAKVNNLPDLSLEFKEKAYRLVEVENKFCSLEESMAAQKIYLQHVMQMLEETQHALKEERFKNCEMEIQLKAAEMATAGAEDIAMKLRESEGEKAQLEIRIKEIIEAYFSLEAGKIENPVNFPAPGIEKLHV